LYANFTFCFGFCAQMIGLSNHVNLIHWKILGTPMVLHT